MCYKRSISFISMHTCELHCKPLPYSIDTILFDVYFLGYIDLSKRRVSSEEIQKCEEKFSKAKTVQYFINKCLVVRLHTGGAVIIAM